MNHDLNRKWIYKSNGFIALLENYIVKDTKKINRCYYFRLFTIRMPTFPLWL